MSSAKRPSKNPLKAAAETVPQRGADGDAGQGGGVVKTVRTPSQAALAGSAPVGSGTGSASDNSAERGYDFSVLRLLRKREGLTLEALANASGVSVAVISKLERNQSRAELDTLYKVARAFNLSASDLIGLAEARLAKNVRETRYEHDGFHFRKIAYGNSTCFYGTAGKGKAVRRPEIHHDDYETCWVLKGCIRINLPQERREIRAGEAVQFDAVLEHTYEALEDSEFILTHVRKENRL